MFMATRSKSVLSVLPGENNERR